MAHSLLDEPLYLRTTADMQLAPQDVLNTLRSRHVDALHHANSVRTSCHFLRARALLSRGTVECRGLPQTPQVSDALDKQFGIWSDVFLDSTDIHDRTSNINFYGPVLFVFEPTVVLLQNGPKIGVTKKNPTAWKTSEHDADRWFESANELHSGFARGRFGQMLVVRTRDGTVDFGTTLQKIILDSTVLEAVDRTPLVTLARQALESAMADGGLRIPIERRVCREVCKCGESYAARVDRTRSMFRP